MNITKINKIVGAILVTTILSSCSQQSIYIENSFFDKSLLKEHLVEHLPEPIAVPLLYVKANEMNNPTAYIDASSFSSNQAVLYSHAVFEYLKESFEHLYAIVGTSKYSTPNISKYAYEIKEATEYEEFFTTSFYSSQSQIDGCWAFVYLNSSFSINNEGDSYLSNPHCLVITHEGVYDFSYDEKHINYSYSVIFDAHSSFWLNEK